MPTIHVQHAAEAGILSGMATPPASVIRSWSARTTPAGADAYVDHFRPSVLSALQRRPGHRGAMVLRRRQDGLIRTTVLTLWTSMAAVAEFAGQLAEKRVKLTLTESCAEWLARKGYSPEFGAREIARLIQDKIKRFFVDEVLFGSLREGGDAVAAIENDDVVIRVTHAGVSTP